MEQNCSKVRAAKSFEQSKVVCCLHGPLNYYCCAKSFAKTNQKTCQFNLLAGKNSRQSAIIRPSTALRCIMNCFTICYAFQRQCAPAHTGILPPSLSKWAVPVVRHPFVAWSDGGRISTACSVMILWIINVKYIPCMFAALSLMQHCALDSVHPHAKKSNAVTFPSLL